MDGSDSTPTRAPLVDLFNAAAAGSCDDIDSALSPNPSVDVNMGCEPDLWTPLHAAAAAGHTAACRSLVGWGASVDAVTAAGETPLHLCAARGHVAAFAFLLAHSTPRSCSCCIPRAGNGVTDGAGCPACDWARKIAEVAAPPLLASASFGLMAGRVAGARPTALHALDAQVCGCNHC